VVLCAQALVVMLTDGDAAAGQAGWGWAAHGNRMLHPPARIYRRPANGANNDNAHPPIHPVQYAAPGTLQGLEKDVYNFICRSYLAYAPARHFCMQRW
jgi:DNA topoisomerase IA